MTEFSRYFAQAASVAPHGWQAELAAQGQCEDRLLRVPTGFGKTLGVLLAWLYRRVDQKDDAWPRRLVWCLPMRVLVEQTESEVQKVLRELDILWDGRSPHEGRVGVHVLMGGADSGDWHLHPEHPAVLIGTQDMLLSRALNRGYGAHRARWPIDFGLLNQDCLWVMDEVQLMDVGLATSGQLQAFRTSCSAKEQLARPGRTWWMSATLQRGWLGKSPETAPLAAELAQTSIAPADRKGHLWEDVHKPLRVEPIKDNSAIAKLAAQAHVDQGSGKDGPTLIVVNRVDAAVDVYAALRKDKRLKETDIRLVHSRFRPNERRHWRETFLNREACGQNTNRIIVATQVVEAGVDMSAAVLVTELAPWSSLVQRFGRAARWGGTAQLVVLDRQIKDDKGAAPYEKSELDAALTALADLSDGAPLALEEFEERHPELLEGLYPYTPKHLLLPHELDDLFDTTADLSGADIDVSRFIRSGEERDVQVFWLPVPAKEAPDEKLRPSRDALCSVPFLKAREWLCAKGNQLKPELRRRVWVWDWLDGKWKVLEARDIYPGQTILVDSKLGGYDPLIGWNPASKSEVPLVEAVVPTLQEQSDSTESDEHLSALREEQTVRWQTIAVHGAQVGREAARLANDLCSQVASLFDIAGRWHDLGKAHEAFQNSIEHTERPLRRDLAKAPSSAWPRKKLYSMPTGGPRKGFRHELVSTLGLFGVLRRHDPDHPALLGPWREVLRLMGSSQTGSMQEEQVSATPSEVEKEILALSAEHFDLLAYLVCSHHGKVRLAWHASPADQDASDSVTRIRGVREGDSLPETTLATSAGDYVALPPSVLCLSPAAMGLSPETGRSWTDRTLGLVQQYSAFQLGFLEALLRAADVRASRAPLADPLLETHTHAYGLERSHSPLEGSASRGAASDPVAPTTPQRSPEYGVRGRASRSDNAGTTSPRASSSTRFVETTLGRLSYTDLAPHLAKRVEDFGLSIVNAEFRQLELDEQFILRIHQEICGDLVPSISGQWRQVDVQVGTHIAPPFYEVPMLMRNFCLDLRAQRQATVSDDNLIELLAFAEGRLLSIHPFQDFNGRVTRLFLSELGARLEIPEVDLAPSPGEESERYLAALRAGDQMNWAPLMEIWRTRLSEGVVD